MSVVFLVVSNEPGSYQVYEIFSDQNVADRYATRMNETSGRDTIEVRPHSVDREVGLVYALESNQYYVAVRLGNKEVIYVEHAKKIGDEVNPCTTVGELVGLKCTAPLVLLVNAASIPGAIDTTYKLLRSAGHG